MNVEWRNQLYVTSTLIHPYIREIYPWKYEENLGKAVFNNPSLLQAIRYRDVFERNVQFSYMFVRDPFDRAVSAYYNKIGIMLK